MVASVMNRRGGRIILGIDPGTATMGWGVIRQEGNRLSDVQHGAIVTPSGWEMPRRLARLFDGVTELGKGSRPETVAVEELFFNTNVTTAITVGQARGVALLAAYRAGVGVAEYTPLQLGARNDVVGLRHRRVGVPRRPGHRHLPRVYIPDGGRQGGVG